MSDKTLYLRAARELRDNEGQWAAYQSTGHCVILAGPGSGKTKTLTIKLARMLNEDVEAPRGIACITYSSECAKELEFRLAALGVEPTGRVFIGTVHSFSLTQIVLPYAKSANLDLPTNFRVATQKEQSHALEDAFTEVIGGPEQPQRWRLRLDNHRRSILNRSSAEWRTADPRLSRFVEAYESHLRARGLIDFDDMTLIALRALKAHEWLRRAILAKYPILAVDEYQDLGRALHQMVIGLCFRTGIRLLAVGDVDQSIYAFNGAYPELLQQLSERDDVEAIRLRLNYRCGSRIVTASSYALGQDRDYAAPDGAHEGVIFFHPLDGTYKQQATLLFRELLPAALERIPNLAPGDIGILYKKAETGNSVAEAAEAHGYPVLRTDNKSLYPRSSKLMRWLELCAVWCCGGWQVGAPRFRRISGEARRLFAEVLRSAEAEIQFQRKLIEYLWETRDSTLRLNTWLERFYISLLNPLLAGCQMLDDEPLIIEELIKNTRAGGSAAQMTLGQFSGHGEGNDRINLSTLHSAKGREWPLVIMMAMDYGEIPWRNVTPKEVLQDRRLFYVGFTRAKLELHIVFTNGQESPFVEEVRNRLLMS